MSNAAIRVTEIVKEYEVYAKPIDLALEVLTRRARHTKFRALDCVSFDVARGEVLGLIGPNGAGKSTLLKIVTGVLEPTAGTVEVSGRVTAILELGLGFNPEYSGRENIYLSGLLYGMERSEVDRKLESIIEFSGLAEFIDRPVKTYSSGMHSRLAFSIATAVDPEILIIDEALAAGDAGFVQKCLRRIRELCSHGRTVVLVSHGTGLLAQLCNRVVWMDRGRVKMVGPAISVVQAYDLAAHQNSDTNSWLETVHDDLGAPADAIITAETSSSERAEAAIELKSLGSETLSTAQQVFRRGPIFIEKVELLNEVGQRSSRLLLCGGATIKIEYRVDGPIPDATLGVAIAVNNRSDLSPVAQYYTQNIRPNESRETYAEDAGRRRPTRRGTLMLQTEHVPFRKGDYLMSVGLLPNEPGCWEFYEYRHFFYPFSVDDAGLDVGAPVFLDLEMSHEHGEVAQKDSHDPDPPIEPVTVAPKPTPPFATLRAEIDAVCKGEGGYPDKWPRHERCPACGEGPLHSTFEKYGFSHSQCGACGLVTVNPYPPPVILQQLYAGQYYTRLREFLELPLLTKGGAVTPFSAPRNVLERVIEKASARNIDGAWLDVGGGLGAFANLVRSRRPRWCVALNEMNPRSVEIAKGVLGLDVRSDNVEALRHSSERFDVISFISVLEHVPYPFAFLAEHAELVKPGGKIVIVIPHFTPLNSAVSKGSSPNAIPPFHVSLFHEAALRRLLGRLQDFEVDSIEQDGAAPFSLIHHVQFGDHWDVKMPTPQKPDPESIRITPYSLSDQVVLNALSEADAKIGDYFARTDGRLYITAFCRKRSNS